MKMRELMEAHSMMNWSSEDAKKAVDQIKRLVSKKPMYLSTLKKVMKEPGLFNAIMKYIRDNGSDIKNTGLKMKAVKHDVVGDDGETYPDINDDLISLDK